MRRGEQEREAELSPGKLPRPWRLANVEASMQSSLVVPGPRPQYTIRSGQCSQFRGAMPHLKQSLQGGQLVGVRDVITG